MISMEEQTDSVTIGTASTGGAVKVYLNLKVMSDEQITSTVDKALALAEKLRIRGSELTSRLKGGK